MINPFLKIIMGLMALIIVVLGFCLLGQGMTLSNAHKALKHERAVKALEHERAVKAILARQVVIEREAVKVETVTRKVYIKSKEVQNAIDKAPNCDAVVSVWRYGIERLRSEASSEAGIDTAEKSD
jgi:hypothetical protein